MRRAAKIDINQPAIVRELRSLGASVQPLHAVGDGCPDLLVGYRDKNYLIEIKNLDGRGRKLTNDQIKWHIKWHGEVVIATSPIEAVGYILGEENVR